MWTPRSPEQLDYAVHQIREALGYSKDERISGPEFLARYRKDNMNLRIVEVDDCELPNSAAEALPSERKIVIRKSTLSDFHCGDRRAAFIVIEELMHDCLRHQGVMHRTIGKDVFAPQGSLKKRQEQEARYAAGAILAPTGAAVECETPEQISERFGLSAEAAKVRFDQVGTLRRRQRGEMRQFSARIVESVRQLEQETGHRLRTFDSFANDNRS
jgi:hypothetical protein